MSAHATGAPRRNGMSIHAPQAVRTGCVGVGTAYSIVQHPKHNAPVYILSIYIEYWYLHTVLGIYTILQYIYWSIYIYSSILALRLWTNLTWCCCLAFSRNMFAHIACAATQRYTVCMYWYQSMNTLYSYLLHHAFHNTFELAHTVICTMELLELVYTCCTHDNRNYSILVCIAMCFPM